MSKVLKRWLAMAMVLLLAMSVLAGCGDKGDDSQQPSEQGNEEEQQPTEEAKNYWDMLGQVSDSSELPDWTGKKLELKAWYTHGNEMPTRRKSEADVVTPEIARVTGVTVNKDEVLDNSGQTADGKLALIAASGDWPALITVGASGSANAAFQQLVENDKLYDLTELIPEYMPNLMKRMENIGGMQMVIDSTYVFPSIGVDGKVYIMPGNFREKFATEIDPTIDPLKYAVFSSPYNTKWPLYVRDDILKKVYPNAKTQEEIEQLYTENGSFTREEVFDMPIRSTDDFVKFLYDVKEVINREGITEGGQPVYPMGTFSIDSWSLGSFLIPNLVGMPRATGNYFTYWDNKDQKLKYMFKEQWFKDEVLTLNKLVRDDVIAKESFIDNLATTQDKINNGQYAVVIQMAPDLNALKQKNKPYTYRQVWTDAPLDLERFLVIDGDLMYFNDNLAICKEAVKEEDLAQILRWWDFMMSDVGQKLADWGPKTAGLWEEKDGKRVFTDKDLEQELVYGQPGDKWLYYALSNPWVDETYLTIGYRGAFIYKFKDKNSPAYVYDRERVAKDAGIYFSPAFVGKIETVKMLWPWFYSFTADIPEVDAAWKARQAFEDPLRKVFVASSDAEFEKLYNEFLSAAERAGYTDAVLEKVNEAYKQKNDQYQKLFGK